MAANKINAFVLQAHITSACPNHCRHCYQRDTRPEHMKLSDFVTLLDQFVDLLNHIGDEQGQEVDGIVTLSGGEPLQHPHFEHCVVAAWRRGLRVAVLTSGNGIDRATAVLLRNAQFVQLSLDGDREAHDAIRGAGDFDRTLGAIRLLKSVRANPIVSFTASASNYKTLPEAARAAADAGATMLWSDRYLPICGAATEEALTPQQTQEYLRILGRAAKGRKSIVSRRRALQFMCGGDCYRCHAGRTILAVDEKCRVMPCRRLPEVLGDFRETSLVQMYSEGLAKEMREFTAPAACEGCEHKDTCRGGLRCLSAAQTGDWRNPDPGCPLLTDASFGSQGKSLLLAESAKPRTIKRPNQAPPRFRGVQRALRPLLERWGDRNE